jgi:hypothetical protein
MKNASEISQRLLRKGALAQETYRVFRQWDFSHPIDANLLASLEGAHGTAAWSNEVRLTLRRRFRNVDAAGSLIALAKQGLPFAEWRSCLLLWICLHEPLFGDFVSEWLYEKCNESVTALRTEDVLPYIDVYWNQRKSSELSEYGAIRTSRDLLRMARDLSLLADEGSSRVFSHAHLSDRCFLYWAHVIAEREGSTSRVPASALWRYALLRPFDIEHELLRLHQFRQLQYEVAGSLVQLSLPCASSNEYAERMAA